MAARKFLKMGEQRDSYGSSNMSGRSSIDPDTYFLNDAYTNQSSKKHKQMKGLTEQVIKKNTLDKPGYERRIAFAAQKSDGLERGSVTEQAIVDDSESQHP